MYAIYPIELAQTVLVSHDAFTAYAKFFGNLNELNAMQNEWLTVPVMSSIGTYKLICAFLILLNAENQ